MTDRYFPIVQATFRQALLEDWDNGKLEYELIKRISKEVNLFTHNKGRIDEPDALRRTLVGVRPID